MTLLIYYLSLPDYQTLFVAHYDVFDLETAIDNSLKPHC